MARRMIKNKGISNECLNIGLAGINKKSLLMKGYPVNRAERRKIERIRKKGRYTYKTPL
jgi:hypothetical protein